MTHDGVRLIGAFYMPISDGPLHVYVSALPFTPINTLLYKTYFSPDPSLPIIIAGQQLEWPIEINLVGHREGITHVAISSDGKWIASRSEDGTVRLWDLEMGYTVLTEVGSEGCSVTSLAFSWDATRTQVASAWSDGIVWLGQWDTDTGDLSFKSLQDTSHSESLCSLAIAFSPDGKQLATGSCPDGVLQLWDTEAGRLSDGQPEAAKSDFDGPHTVISLSFAPYKPWLLTATNNILQLWDIGTGASISDPLKECECVIDSILFSPNGAWFASCTGQDTLLWDTETTSPVHKLVHHMTIPHGIEPHSIFSFSPDSASFIMAEYFGTRKIQRWNVETGVPVGQPVPFPRTEVQVSTVALSFDCTRAIIGSHNGTLQLWDLDSTSDGACEHANEIFPLAAFSPSDIQVATSSADGVVLHLWDAASGIGRQINKHEDVKRLKYSPDGTHLVNLSACRFELLSTETGDPVGDPLEIILQKAIVIFSPNGRWLAISAGNGVIQVRDAQTGALAATLGGHINPVELSFSPDGTRLATMLQDGIVQLWNPETGVALVGPPTDDWKFSETSPVNNTMPGCDETFIGLSSKGTYVARLPRFRLWNVELAAEVEMKTDIHTRAVSIAFSPDESLLLIVAWEKEADNIPGYHCFARLWNTATGTPIGERLILDDLNDIWYGCTFVFSHHGLRVAGGTPMKTRIWDVQTGSPIGPVLYGDATILTSTLIRNPALVFSDTLNEWNLGDSSSISKHLYVTLLFLLIRYLNSMYCTCRQIV
jgi:WD40 repeat protein